MSENILEKIIKKKIEKINHLKKSTNLEKLKNNIDINNNFINFKEKIEKSLNIECKLHDERLSSFEAKEQNEIIKKNKIQPNPGIDALAAQVILESWLREKSKNV